MTRYEEGPTEESQRLCRTLLSSPQVPPDKTLFSDELFEGTLNMIKDQNETRVIRDIAQLIVPPAEILALRGHVHLQSLREKTNAGWINAIPICGPRPQPDYGLGFRREAFTAEQFKKIEPFIGNVLEDCSYFAATYDMYFPFLTSEVKCGAAALDIADRQNAHSQSVALRGLVELFRLVDRAREIHRQICGFSISHSDENVRIWGHYPVIKDDRIAFYRHPIAKFDISPTAEGDQRWKAYTFVRNVYDLWVPDHLKKICTAIDRLPSHLGFLTGASSRSEGHTTLSQSDLSGELERHSLVDRQMTQASQVPPNITSHINLTNFKRRKK